MANFNTPTRLPYSPEQMLVLIEQLHTAGHLTLGEFQSLHAFVEFHAGSDIPEYTEAAPLEPPVL